MKFGKLLGLLVVALGVCAVAQAQVSVYGMYTANRLGKIECFDPLLLCSANNTANGVAKQAPSQYDSVNLTGGWGGVTYDFHNVGPVRLGLDLRAGEGHSSKSATSSGGGSGAAVTQNILAGVKATFHTPIRVLKPYVQGSVGWSRSNASEPCPTNVIPCPGSSTPTPVPPRIFDNFLVYEGFAGLDVKLFPIMDFRAIELGIGNMNRIGSGQGTSSFGVKSIGLGIVFHLPAS